MSSAECPAAAQKGAPVTMLKRLATSPRFLVYVSCTLLALIVSHWMGKDMQWDTLDYHFYAGFSAIHDRFGLDYFAAAPQAYLIPYAYAPFYLLVASGLSALEVAGILAVIQSAILWLTYELALAVAPQGSARGRFAVGACAAFLALANPVLMEQFGSSFADITTAELVLAGVLVLIAAVRSPSMWRVALAGFLLGAATALKLTNSLDAISLTIVPLFLPLRWPKRWSSAALYALSVGLGFVLVSLPWAIELWRHFANPLFPLLNDIFRSPEYTTAPVVDYRFIPTSLLAALWRPFAMMARVRMVHVERPAPDLRYALLIALAMLLVLARWGSRWRAGQAFARKASGSAASRALLALGSAFLLNWVIWLWLFGNSRYFIPMACVAGVLVVALACRLLIAWPRVLACVLAALLLAQIYQVQAGAVYRPHYPWAGERWFGVSLPQSIGSQPALYLTVGVQSNSFVVPYLPAGSGVINLEGDYVLGPDGTNGARIRELIKRFSPHLRVLVLDSRVDAERDTDVPHLDNVNDAVEPFGLRVDSKSCSRIVARATPKLEIVTAARALPQLPASAWYTRYLVTCPLVPDPGRWAALAATEPAANLSLDHLEDACPALFQPRRPETYLTGSDPKGYFWVRRYSNTDVFAWVHAGKVAFEKLIGSGRGRLQNVGSELAWESAPLRVVCARRSDGDFLRVLPPGQ
ncbi:MAG: glycosyltransferase family 87 protein [Steroidobacteraceae bacterium]